MPAGDLCTLSDVTAFLTGDQALGTAALTALSFLITQVSAWAQGYCERTFAGSQVNNWLTDGTGGDTLPLPNTPLVAVGVVTVDGIAIAPSSDGISYGWVADDRSITIQRGRFTRGRKNIRIGYTSGWNYVFTAGAGGNAQLDTITGIPQDLRWAVVETVALRYKRRTSLGKNSEGLTGQSTSYDNSIAPKDALATLNQYRKVTPW